MRDWLRKKLIKYAYRHLFNIINEEDILRVMDIPFRTKDGIVYRKAMFYRGKELSPERVEALRRSAEMFTDSDIWKILRNEVRYIANRKMFEESGSTIDLIYGKAILRTIEVMEKKLSTVTGTRQKDKDVV